MISKKTIMFIKENDDSCIMSVNKIYIVHYYEKKMLTKQTLIPYIKGLFD